MYNPIKPLPQDAHSLASNELVALAQVWRERHQELEKTGAYQEFIKRLKREWAIETGIIERLYTWDRGVTEVLIEQGIDASLIAHRGGLDRGEADHIKVIIEDQLGIVEGLFSFIKGDQPLTEHFIRGLQAQFTAHQDTTEAMTPDGKMIHVKIAKGEYKKLPNNPRRPDGIIHEYCPPGDTTSSEMTNLVKWYQEAVAQNHAPEVLSAWLHHGFTKIHPFQDGNGRVARALASLVFLKAGMFPLVIRDQDRKEYIEALENADQGDLKPLVLMFSRRQRDSVLQALGLEQLSQQSRHAEQIITSTIKLLKERFAAEKTKLQQVYETAEDLRQLAQGRIQEIASTLNRELAGVTPRGEQTYHANVSSADNNAANSHYFAGQIVDMARIFKYFANTEKHRSWVRLSIFTKVRFELVISFHGYGQGETGIMAASAFTAQRIPREDGGTDPVNTRPADLEVFQFNYVESVESTTTRFKEWIEGAIALALSEWRQAIGV